MENKIKQTILFFKIIITTSYEYFGIKFMQMSVWIIGKNNKIYKIYILPKIKTKFLHNSDTHKFDLLLYHWDFKIIEIKTEKKIGF